MTFSMTGTVTVLAIILTQLLQGSKDLLVRLVWLRYINVVLSFLSYMYIVIFQAKK